MVVAFVTSTGLCRGTPGSCSSIHWTVSYCWKAGQQQASGLLLSQPGSQDIQFSQTASYFHLIAHKLVSSRLSKTWQHILFTLVGRVFIGYLWTISINRIWREDIQKTDPWLHSLSLRRQAVHFLFPQISKCIINRAQNKLPKSLQMAATRKYTIFSNALRRNIFFTWF